MKQNHKLAIALSAGLATGTAAGYFVAKAMLTKKYQEISEAEILAVKKHYGMVFDEEKYDDPAEAAKADRERTHDYLARLDKLEYSPTDSGEEREDFQEAEAPAADPVEPEEVDEPAATVDSKPNFDEAYPYPISQREFLDDADEYDKLTITYYAGDDIVADSRDEPINDIKKLIGSCHKKFMGFDPTEPHIVYVRNNIMQADYEVLYDPEAFITAVHGIPTEPSE